MEPGAITISGPNTTDTPLYVSGSLSVTLTPMDRKILRQAPYWSASPLAAHPGCVPFSCKATPSAVAFLTGEKHRSAEMDVNPTRFALSPVKTVGKSCIMHSRRVGFLNVVFLLSLYFGLTNSGMRPSHLFKASRYGSAAKRSPLIFPGKGEKPVFGSLTSPSLCPFARRSGSSWLYSILIVLVSPVSSFVSLQIAPTACLALRGIAMEFIMRFFSTDTPRASGRVWNANPFVS
mmetsp:Transcript_9985/g.16579  ORF Transcript_9985/g.16579 Transcript_9985/m.16579 type:complete len:234 (-) Transcript_9985:364-1065(-)